MYDRPENISTADVEIALVELTAYKAKVYAAVVNAHNRGLGDAGTRALNDRKLALITAEHKALELYLRARKACDEAGI